MFRGGNGIGRGVSIKKSPGRLQRGAVRGGVKASKPSPRRPAVESLRSRTAAVAQVRRGLSTGRATQSPQPGCHRDLRMARTGSVPREGLGRQNRHVKSKEKRGPDCSPIPRGARGLLLADLTRSLKGTLWTESVKHRRRGFASLRGGLHARSGRHKPHLQAVIQGLADALKHPQRVARVVSVFQARND